MNNSSSDSGGRDSYYDGMRAIAIAIVVGVHWVSPYAPILFGGYVGVDIFFVLSGFIITTILWRRKPVGSVPNQYGRFLVGRLKRLYPALLGLLVVGTLVVWAFHAPVPVGEAIQSAFLAVFQTSSFVRALELSQVEPFAHTWSLAVEWLFYLLWPILLLVAKARAISLQKIAASAFAMAALLFLISLLATPEWFYYGPTSRSAQLLVGCATATLVLSGALQPLLRRTKAFVAICWIALAGILVWAFFGVQEMQPLYRFVGYPLVTAATAVLLLVPLLAPDSKVRAVVGNKVFAFIGRISYSLYLWHLLGIQVLDKDAIALPLPVLAAAAILGTVLFTWASYKLLEKPFVGTGARSFAVGRISDEVRR